MKMTTAVRLLQLLPTRVEKAVTVKELASKFCDGRATSGDIRNMQRYLSDLSADSADTSALVEVAEGDPRRFYLKLSNVAQWFMTEEVALNILLTRQVLGRSMGSVKRMSVSPQIDMAEQLVGASPETQQIRQRVRIVPDGIGRLPAKIGPQILQPVLDAVAKRKKLSFAYVNFKGNESQPLVTPQGLVAKDGAIYLLATKGLGDKPHHYALHRMRTAEVDHRPAQEQPDFDLDRYIEESHQLSHTIDMEPVELKLRVAPGTLYHFRERPLSPEQTIGRATGPQGWHVVTAHVPVTFLLVPFLLSMGGGIEVLSPASVREEMAERVRAMAAHYALGA